jgi:putative heme iron utilization protein
MTHYEIRQEPSVMFKSWAVVAIDEGGNKRCVMRHLSKHQASVMLKCLQMMGAALNVE